MIWLTIQHSLYPSTANLARLEPLTALETDAVTAFYYLYQEQVSFLTASAMEVWPEEIRGPMMAHFNLEKDVLGFDYSEQGLKDTLVLRLNSIHKKAEKALIGVRAVVDERKCDFPGLHRLVETEKASSDACVNNLRSCAWCRRTSDPRQKERTRSRYLFTADHRAHQYT
jgi:hypothetical protein